MGHRARVALVALAACRSELRFSPAAPAEVRAHLSDGDTWLRYHDTNVSARELASRCKSGPCPLDDAQVTWQVGRYTNVVDGGLIARDAVALGLVGALVYGNLECFGPGCDTAAKVAVGVGDGLIALGVVGVIVAAVMWRNFRGD